MCWYLFIGKHKTFKDDTLISRTRQTFGTSDLVINVCSAIYFIHLFQLISFFIQLIETVILLVFDSNIFYSFISVTIPSLSS